MFADEPQSPTAARHEMREGGSDGKAPIRELDKILQGYADEMGIGDDDDIGMERQISTLEELSKSKSRMIRDEEDI